MAEIQTRNSSDRAEPAGKIRTMWHPLLVRMLTVALGSAFKVEQELYVGKMPLRVDIFLIRQQEGELSEPLTGVLSALLPLLNNFTFIEFKAPTDTMERGDFSHLIACAYLWHGQRTDRVPHDQISLVVLTPTVSGPMHDDLIALGCDVSGEQPGIYRVTGLPFAAWLVETDVMAGLGQPVLSLVSRLFLNDPGSIIDKWANGPFANMVEWMVQQVRQFDPEEDSAVQQALSENLAELQEQLLTKMLARNAPRAVVAGAITGRTVAQACRRKSGCAGLSLEQRLAGLSEQEAARMRELLERKKE